MTRYSHLLSPLALGRTEIRNRILVSAHVPGFAENNRPGDKYIRYHRTYAANGVGLQITGGTPVHPSGLLGTTSDALWNMDDSIIPGYEALGKAVREEGGKILAQLAHSGGTVQINQPGRASWSASAIRSEISGNVSVAMSQEQIGEIIQAYADAAARVRLGNLDGIEILAAFGFLPQAFLSPLTNQRNDKYGGSAENRLRFTLELLSAVRTALGPERILGLRIPGDEFESGGLCLDDMKRVAATLSQRGLVDYLSVIAHTNISHTGRSLHWPPTPAQHGLFIPLATAIKSVVDIPVFGVGRVTSPELAERIIENKQADMVGMTRANICDPQLVSKIKAGQVERIRPCVGANTCIANRYVGKPISCMHNAAVSQPGSQLLPTRSPRDIAIVGAGPAGLESARICAERGHRVTVFEASAQAGGQLRLWSSVTSMAELEGIIQWRVRELDRLGVSIKYNHTVTLQDLETTSFDAIICAQGASDYTRQLEGSHAIKIMSPQQLLREPTNTARRAIVLNEGRGQAGLVAAEVLLDCGTSVEVITSDIAVGSDLDPTVRNAWYSRLGKKNCDFSAALNVLSAADSSLQLRNVFDGRIQWRNDIDLVIDWPGSRANTDLAQPTVGTTHRVGDCVAPRTLEIAIAEATAIANTL